MVSRPDKDGIGHVAGKRGTWAWLALGHRLCFWPWFPGMLLGVGNVSLEAFDHCHRWGQLLVHDLLAGRFQGGFVVLLPRLANTLRAWMSPRGTAALLRSRIIAMTACVAAPNDEAQAKSSSRVSALWPSSSPRGPC